MVANSKHQPRRGRKGTVDADFLPATLPMRFHAPLMSKVVDKGTVYERTVYLDPNTVQGQEDVLSATISSFMQSGGLRRSKSPERRRKDAEGKSRRYGRRREHEAWMKDAAGQPTKPSPHPFYPTPYRQTSRRGK